MPFTWTELIDDIKVRGMIPTSQNTFTEQRLLNLANAQLRAKILPLVDRCHEDFYSYDVDTALNATGIYQLHKRAVGTKLIDCALVDGDDRYDLTRYWEEDISNFNQNPATYGFYLKRNTIYLVPKVPAGFGTFRQTIMLRPPTIVKNSDAAQITGIDTGTGVITCSTVPSTWTTADTFDMVQDEPHFDTLSIDLAASAVVTGIAGTITVTPASLNSRLAIGDWVGLAGETPVVQVPVEVNPLLAQYVANICLQGQTDKAALELGMKEAESLEKSLLSMLNPRVQKEGKKIVNRTGILRRGL